MNCPIAWHPWLSAIVADGRLMWFRAGNYPVGELVTYGIVIATYLTWIALTRNRTGERERRLLWSVRTILPIALGGSILINFLLLSFAHSLRQMAERPTPPAFDARPIQVQEYFIENWQSTDTHGL